MHAFLDQCPHFSRQGANRAFELGGLRYHVARIAGVEFAYRNNRGFQRIDAA